MNNSDFYFLKYSFFGEPEECVVEYECDEFNREISNSSDVDDDHNEIAQCNDFLHSYLGYFENAEPDTHWKKITVEEYKGLTESFEQLEGLKNTIKKLEFIIRCKDVQLKEIKKRVEPDQSECINISHL